jgi:hypothetical protein
MFGAALFVLSSLAFAVLAFARHPIYGLYFYLASIYVHPPSRWWGPMLPDLRWALTSALITAAAIVWHRGRLAEKAPWYSSGAAIILIAYASLMVVQTAWALDVQTHLDGTIKYLKYLIAFWIFYRICDRPETLRDAMLGHVLGCALLGIFAISIGREGDRLDGVGGPGLDDANTLGMYLATGLVLGMGLVLVLKGWRRLALLGLLGLVATGFVLANSRGALLGLVAGGATLLITKSRVHSKGFWVLALVGLVGMAAVVDKKFVDRMFTIGDVVEVSEDADASARSRLAIYEAQVRMALDHPFGAGHRGTATLSPQYIEQRWLTTAQSGDSGEAQRSSHNTFMSTLVEQGFVGAMLFLALLLWLCMTILRLRRMVARRDVNPTVATLAGSIAGALMVVIFAGTATDYLLAEVQFWLFAALVSACQLLETARAQQTADAKGGVKPGAGAVRRIARGA